MSLRYCCYKSRWSINSVSSYFVPLSFDSIASCRFRVSRREFTVSRGSLRDQPIIYIKISINMNENILNNTYIFLKKATNSLPKDYFAFSILTLMLVDMTHQYKMLIRGQFGVAW